MALTLDDAAHTWSVLARHLDGFISAWEATRQPPPLAEHLPAEPPALRRLALIELIKVDLEFRGKHGPDQPLERYLAEHPEFGEAGLPDDLVFEDFHLRRARGQPVELADYAARFPRQASALRRLVGAGDASNSTALFGGARRPPEFEAGQTVDDFHLIVKLGKGAFGSVFLARQISIPRLVAVKVTADRGIEAQTLGQLDHPNIVRVYDQRRLPERRVRLLYMQYVPGGTLQGVIERARRLPPAERSGRLILEVIDAELERAGQTPGDSSACRKLAASSWPEATCRVGVQLALALRYAHAKDVLHRDVKPANVLLAGDGTPKLADFNISYSAQLEGSAPAAYFGGSLAYMSPEQLEAYNPEHPRTPDQLDGRADIYSLGVLLWELLHGQRPFADERVTGVWPEALADMTTRRRGGPPRLDTRRLEAGYADVQPVLARCLASEPADRYPDGAALARDLALCLQPRARALLRGVRSGWRYWLRRHALWWVLLAALVPNALAGKFNYDYNMGYLRKALADPAATATLDRVQLVVNGVAFPLGLLILTWLGWSATRHVRPAGAEPIRAGPDQPAAAPEAMLREARRRILSLGQYCAGVGIGLWLVAGLVYPVALDVWIDMPAGGYARFLTSLAVCGLIAAAYPFFGVTWLAVRVFYPALPRADSALEDDESRLIALGRVAQGYLVLAVGVPIAGMFLLALEMFGLGEAPSRDDLAALLTLTVVGGLGLGAAFPAHTAIQRDLQALLVAARPPEAFDTGAETGTL